MLATLCRRSAIWHAYNDTCLSCPVVPCRALSCPVVPSVAWAAAKLVVVTYDTTGLVPCFSVDDCIAAGKFFPFNNKIVEGDFEAACAGEGVQVGGHQ